MDAVRESGDHPTSTAAFVEGEVQGECDDACSICLESFSPSDPSTVTNCKHEFHLHCILEWCHRSSNCPLCWRAVSLKDEGSQLLLEAVEHERSVRTNRSRNRTAFYHPTHVNFDLNLRTDSSEVDLEEHIFQHLAAAAVMRSRHHAILREGQRSRTSLQGNRAFFFSAPNAPHEASGLISLNPVGGENRSTAVSSASASILNTSIRDAHMAVTLSAPQTHDVSARRIGSNVASANRQRISSETRSFASQSSLGSQSIAEPSDLQSMSDSLRSRFNAWSMRYKESISRNTRGWKERLFSRSTSMADLGSGVRRDVNYGIASVSRMMERPDSRANNGSGHASESSHAGRSTRNE